MKPTIYLATDHAGFELKNAVREWLVAEGYQVEDCGATTYDPEDDFPDYIKLAARAVSQKPKVRKAVIFGGSGQGEAMVANRFLGVRAAVYYGGTEEIISLSREHNDANVLSIGARFVDEKKAKKVIQKWLTTKPLPAKKYARRNLKLRDLTKKLLDLLGKELH